MRVKKELNIQIGERIKLSREDRALTQYISDLERGVVGISIPTLKRLCTHLEVSSDRILFDRQTEACAAAIGEKCRSLSDSQFRMAMDILDRFLSAVEEERKRSGL